MLVRMFLHLLTKIVNYHSGYGWWTKEDILLKYFNRIKMSTLHFVFVPTLYVWFNTYDYQETKFPTSNPELDNIIIQNLIKDHTNIKSITYPLEPFSYNYNLKTNLIHVWAYNKDMKEITACNLAEILYNYNPDNRGPDTWMLQDINIVTEEQAKRFGYYAIEMVPKLLQIFVEKEVDLKSLPCVEWNCNSC